MTVIHTVTCDRCGKSWNLNEYPIYKPNQQYKVGDEHIDDLCKECFDSLNKGLDDIHKAYNKERGRFLKGFFRRY